MWKSFEYLEFFCKIDSNKLFVRDFLESQERAVKDPKNVHFTLSSIENKRIFIFQSKQLVTKI